MACRQNHISAGQGSVYRWLPGAADFRASQDLTSTPLSGDSGRAVAVTRLSNVICGRVDHVRTNSTRTSWQVLLPDAIFQQHPQDPSGVAQYQLHTPEVHPGSAHRIPQT